MYNNNDSRKIIIIGRQKQIKREKIIILCSSIVTLIITLSIFMTIGYNKYGKQIYASAKINQISEQNEIEKLLVNDSIKQKIENKNNIYMSINDDPNADAAATVSNNTESIIKGENSYPIRKDGKKVVYLTFDDGPSIENTADILAILNKYDVKATFFVTGSAASASNDTKELIKEIAKEGNSIGNHTYSHNYSKLYPGRRIDSKTFMEEIKKTDDVLKDILGESYTTKAIRFPGGYWSWNGRSEVRPLLDKGGYSIINWNALNEDAEGKTKNAKELIESLKTTTENLGPNADSIVVLMHDTYGKRETVKALPDIIEYLKNKGFEFRTIK